MIGEYIMNCRGSAKAIIILSILFVAILIGGFAAVFYFTNEIEAYQQASTGADAFFRSHTPQPFINRAVDAKPYHYDNQHEDALYFYETPEGLLHCTAVSFLSSCW